MNFVTKGFEKVAVANLENAKALMRALSDLNCNESIARQEVIGKEGSFGYMTCFNDTEIATGTMDDAQRIASWVLRLGCSSVTIKVSEGDE